MLFVTKYRWVIYEKYLEKKQQIVDLYSRYRFNLVKLIQWKLEWQTLRLESLLQM